MKTRLFFVFLTVVLLCFSSVSRSESRDEIIDNPLFETSNTRWKVLDDDYAAIQGANSNALLELIKDKKGCHIDYLSGVKYEKPLDKLYDYIFTTKKNGYAVTVKHDYHVVGAEANQEFRHSLNTDDFSDRAKKSLISLFKRASRDDISSTVRVSYAINKSQTTAENQYILDQQLVSFGEFSLYDFIDVSDKLGCD